MTIRSCIEESLKELEGTLWCLSDDVYFFRETEIVESFYDEFNDSEAYTVQIYAANVSNTKMRCIDFYILAEHFCCYSPQELVYDELKRLNCTKIS